MRSVRVARAFFAITAALLAANLLLQLGLSVVGGGDADPRLGVRLLRLFSYFTVQSNILVLVSCLVLARDPMEVGSRAFRVLRLDALVGISVTFVVVQVALRGALELDGLEIVTDTIFHWVAPILAVIGWAVFGPRPRWSRDLLLPALAWPVGWVAYTFAHGAVSGWYPYPFIDVEEIGYGSALLNAGLVTVVLLLVAAAYVALDHRLAPVPTADRSAEQPVEPG